MTAHGVITLVVVVLAVAAFAWNRVPAAVVAVAASLVLYFTGVLTMAETLSGFGDPVVVLVAAAAVVAAGLENAGAGAWAGQHLLRRASVGASTGTSDTARLVTLMVAAAVFSGLTGMNGAVVALAPPVVAVAARTGTAPSRLMIPLAFACLAGASLTLLGSPVNLVVATTASEAGVGNVGFFGWAALGVPQLLGTIAITAGLGKHLLPERQARPLPGGPRPGARDPGEAGPVAEAVVPRGSALAGQAVFPGMATEGAGLMILGVRRDGTGPRETGASGAPVPLRAGDHLLLRGGREALDGYLAGPGTLIEVVRKRGAALGGSAPAALAIGGLLIVLLAFGLLPPPVAALLGAALMVLARVLTLPQLYRGVDWNACVLIGAMIPPAIALSKTGAAAVLGGQVAGALGGPYAVLAVIFAVTAALGQFIPGPAAALVTTPVGLAAASELHVSGLPLLLGAAMGASASFLTPFANGVSPLVYEPGGYRPGDFWRLGLAVAAWTMLVTVLIAPLVWSF